MPAPPDPDDIRPVELSELRSAARETPRVRPMPRPQNAPTAPVLPEAPKKRGVGLAIAGGVVIAGAVAVAAWLGFDRHRGQNDGPPPSADSQAARDVRPDEKETADEKAADVPSTAAVENTSREPSPPTKANKPTPNPVETKATPDLRRALYSVLISDSAGGERFRLGTAWAVGPRRLATSGAVVMAVEELQKSGMSAVVSRAGETKENHVTGIHAHPAYRRAFEEASVAREELEKARGANAPSKKVGRSDDSRSDIAQVARDRLDGAYDAQADCDVGLLDVDQTLETTLTPLFGALPSERFQCKLAGLPFAVDQYRASEPGPADRVQQFTFNIAPGAGDDRDAHLILAFSGDLARRNWSGSPILNSAGRVVGVYSRPLPASDDASGESDRPISHAVTPIARLREMAPELK
jgi:hypothetical protein